jgi:NAD(P)-dependent dehydrogenase (short-subunit alcohol dehydrogenase family)
MTILITGAGKGIGAALAFQLAADGHTVIALSRNAERLGQLKQRVLNAYPKAEIEIIASDITDRQTISGLVDQVAVKFNHLDALINNAGTLLNKPFEKISLEELEQVYAVNVFAPFQLMQVFLPLLEQSKHAHIVNISSMGGVQGSAKFAGLSAYSSSKAALAGLTELLAEELKERNISVNCLALGAAQTEMLEHAFPGYKAPLSAADMAQWIGWFTVNGHHFFNGKILPVALSTP